MDAFPAFFPLKDRRVVIAGDGEPAEARSRLFAGSPAEVVRVAGPAALASAAYAGAHLIFIASHDDAFAVAAAAAARAGGAPINVFDRPALSDFHTPAIVDRGAVVAAVGTTGSAPLMAGLLRAEIEARIPESAGRVAVGLGERRAAVTAKFPDMVERRAFLRAVLAGPEPDGESLDALIAQGWTAVGRVWLIEAPAADDLISMRAQRALNFADVVVAPPAAAGLIATHARRDAERLDAAGAEQLADLANAGKTVAVIGAEPGVAAALAAAGVAVQTLRPAPDAP
ncbi:MAG TPA: NAD(P)-dependent oxidoreductase [Caulobacteraceae bacterium]